MAWPSIRTDDWDEMARQQREVAASENGVYPAPGDRVTLPSGVTTANARLHADEVTALVAYWERRYGAGDTWATDRGDHLIVLAYGGRGPDGRPARQGTDELDATQAAVVWMALDARAAQLDPMCDVARVPLAPLPPASGRRVTITRRGHCPGTFTYATDTQSRLNRAGRVGVAYERVYHVIPRPPLLDPLGSLLRLALLAGLVYLVATEESHAEG